MFVELVDHLIRNKHCFVCKHFKSMFSRYTTFDYGTCMKQNQYNPFTKENYCNGKSFEPCEIAYKSSSQSFTVDNSTGNPNDNSTGNPLSHSSKQN